MPSIEFSRVSKKYRASLIIDDLSFCAPKGKITVILGPSGAGKTTILRLIAGFEKPNSGEIRFGENLVSTYSYALEPRKRKVGMVFQEFALWPHLSILKNIMFAMKDREIKGRREQARRLLEMVHLEEKEQKYPSELSGGEKQRTAIVRALASDPEILLLDEPFSDVEKSLREKLIEELEILISSLHPTVVYVTHNQEEAFSVAEKVVIIKSGVLHQQGESKDVYFNPTDCFTAQFLGYKTFLSFPLNNSNTKRKCSVPSRSIFAYRPEDIAISEDHEKTWNVLTTVFRNGKWISKLVSGNEVIYAQSDEFHAPGTAAGVRVLRPAVLISHG